MPNVDGVLRDIAKWKYIIVTDLWQSFYQIPLEHGSMRFCGVVTPVKGLRVYTQSAMGMPGSETCVEELMSRVLGEFIMQGWVAKIVDDLYVGGNDPEEALSHWTSVLKALRKNNLGLNASKTVIFPLQTTILGWIWSSGKLRASPHRLAALSQVQPPSTVQGLRSFIGAYKSLSRVLPGYTKLLDPLDQATAGKQSRDKLVCNDSMLLAFEDAQKALDTCKEITMPQPNDTLHIVTDASVKEKGIAATLYILRDGKTSIAGFYSAKLKKHQQGWLPCQLDALSIGAAMKHFAPFIIQSKHPVQVLTDSKPCVQAHSKLLRGEFSASAHVTSFLSICSRYRVSVSHIAGSKNIPSDYASRHPMSCPESSCQICKLVSELEESVMYSLSVQDVIDGSSRMPFANRIASLATQRECPDLRCVHAHLSQGTRPSKRDVKIQDVKRYLQRVTIASDGLLVVVSDAPFRTATERIVVSRSVLHGLVTAVHLRFNHPSPFQMQQVMARYFYALDMEGAIKTTCSSCHHCNSLKYIPPPLVPQSRCSPPDIIGSSFALDVMCRSGQCILILRETISSYAVTRLIDNEQHQTSWDAILSLVTEMRSCCRSVEVRVDNASGLKALESDSVLKSHDIILVFGETKNVNKSPVAEYAVKELGLECLHICPERGPVTTVTLALATANMNSRIRHHGLSAKEVWTQCDQVTGDQLALDDRQIILKQHCERSLNHGASALSKSKGKGSYTVLHIQVGDLLYIVSDGDKTKVREKYLVTDLCSDNMCPVRKFTKSQFRSRSYKVKMCVWAIPCGSNYLATTSRGHCAGSWQSPAGASAFILCACPGLAFPFAQGWPCTHHAPWPSIAPIWPCHPTTPTIPRCIWSASSHMQARCSIPTSCPTRDWIAS